MKTIFSFTILLLASFCMTAQPIPRLAETPPMGWNSWDCFGMDVTEADMMATAGYMARHLKKYGWEYIVLDMGWNYGEGLTTSNFRIKNPPQVIDEWGRLIPNPRKFPSSAGGKGLKPLADHVHGLGLKFGLHIMRGIPWQAVEQNTPIKGTPYRARDIATEANACRWFHGLVTIDMSKPGAQEYYNSILELYTEWGVDYIKADDMLKNPYHEGEIEGVRKAIDKFGRPIVLSLSAGPVPTELAPHLRQNAHLWRISGDMWDDWSFIKKTFAYCRQWQDFITPNHWPDADMLPLGKLRINGTDGMLAEAIGKKHEETVNEFDRLSPDERQTLLSLWMIFRSPLMMGGSLLELDKTLLKQLTNKEALYVNQHSTNNRELHASETEIVWVANDPQTGDKFVALFNSENEKAAQVEVSWEDLGITGKYKVRDLWKKKNLGTFNGKFGMVLPPHGAGLLRLKSFKKG